MLSLASFRMRTHLLLLIEGEVFLERAPADYSMTRILWRSYGVSSKRGRVFEAQTQHQCESRLLLSGKHLLSRIIAFLLAVSVSRQSY